MDTAQRQEFRELLQARRRELLEDAGRTVGGMTRSKDNTPDPNDRASIESDHISLLRIRDRERKLIAKIDEALVRLEEGTYGICEECGEAISAERLRVRPVTTLCIRCKEEQESAERRRRGEG